MLVSRMTLSGVTDIKIGVCVCLFPYQCVDGCQCQCFLNGCYMQQFIIAQRIDAEHFPR